MNRASPAAAGRHARIFEIDPAIEGYKRTLALALRGAVPLAVWMSNCDRRLVDPLRWSDHRAIADLYDRRGDSASARAHRLTGNPMTPNASMEVPRRSS